jgi:hypothetical protein
MKRNMLEDAVARLTWNHRTGDGLREDLVIYAASYCKVVVTRDGHLTVTKAGMVIAAPDEIKTIPIDDLETAYEHIRAWGLSATGVITGLFLAAQLYG